MVDSNFANTISVRQTWPPRPIAKVSTKSPSTFRQFCFGTAFGVIVGALCGAFLPDRLLGAGALGNVKFPETPATSLTRENHSPTPLSQLSDIQASADTSHAWDAD